MPDTPTQCVANVAGKVLLMDSLAEEIENATNLLDFFSEVYCSTYVNSLVTLKDGVSKIIPGSLDWNIEMQLQRVFGPFDNDKFTEIAFNALDHYEMDVEAGFVTQDDSTLISAVVPNAEAINRCDSVII